MTSMDREERLRRQEYDDGNATDTVWFGKGATSTRAYHGDRNCDNIQDGQETVAGTRQGAQHRWFAPCAVCILDGIPPKEPDGDADAESGTV